MTIIRRVYAYLLTLVGLLLVSSAAANLAQVLVDVALGATVTQDQAFVRDSVARGGAAALVGLPVWLLHWRWIDGRAQRDPDERRSALRHLYLTAVLAAASLVACVAANTTFDDTFRTLLGRAVGGSAAVSIVEPLPFVVVATIVWIAHWRVAERDRAAIGEPSANGALRRWYLFVGALVALIVLLTRTRDLLSMVWLSVVDPSAVVSGSVAAAAATTLVSLGAWVLLWRFLPARVARAAPGVDEGTTLRAVYLFGASAVGIVGALLGTSQVLYYSLGRVLGLERPGGTAANLAVAVVGPACLVIVYGAAWAYHRAAIRHTADALADEHGAAGIRRLYVHLVSLVSLGVWASGLGGLLWALGDVVTQPAVDSFDVRERLALSVTMVVVGGPVWLRHWRARPTDPSETQSLARRLYVYLALIAAALTLVGATAVMLYRLLLLVLGAVESMAIAVDLAHTVALVIVAAAIASYHWRILRTDTPLPRLAVSQSAPARVAATVRLDAADADSLNRALHALRATGVDVTVLAAPVET